MQAVSDKIKKQLAKFYVVATPIGNLDDISNRALSVLNDVQHILAEDTRHSKVLLNHYGINTPCRSCHQHNEASLLEWVEDRLSLGEDIAIISDAGTPLISDPGYVLVKQLRQKGYSIHPVPGACALISALSVSGLATNQFIFDGFLPNKSSARKKQLQQYCVEPRTVVLYESSHRIKSCLQDCVDVLGQGRHLVLARELTKKFETLLSGTTKDLLTKLEQDAMQTKGEFVLLIEGVVVSNDVDRQTLEVYDTLKKELGDLLPAKKIAGITAKLTETKKNQVYQAVLAKENP